MLGHTEISILNGGLNYWMSKGYSLSHDSNLFHLKVRKFEIILNISLSWVKIFFKEEKFESKLDAYTFVRDYDQIISNKNELILDSRPLQHYEMGHIPMSLNVPYNELFDRETGLLKTKEELLARRTLLNNFFVLSYFNLDHFSSSI